MYAAQAANGVANIGVYLFRSEGSVHNLFQQKHNDAPCDMPPKSLALGASGHVMSCQVKLANLQFEAYDLFGRLPCDMEPGILQELEF
jgi:hypothetical protein